MKVLFLSAEAAPLVKVGGLGDVAGALPEHLRDEGHDVRVVIPWTGSVRLSGATPRWKGRFRIPSAPRLPEADLFEVDAGNGPVCLLSGPLISRDEPVYGGDPAREIAKFLFFCRAALESARFFDFQPDVVHAHDWHAAGAAAWLATGGAADPFFGPAARIVTIHNLPYMGRGAGPLLSDFGLGPADSPVVPFWARDALLPLGIFHADIVSTVSARYAQEILSHEFGCGLEGLLGVRAAEGRLRGIRNGLDQELYDPAKDPALAFRFDDTSLSDRRGNKDALFEELHLDGNGGAPLLAIVSRLDRQKGIDYAMPAIAGWLAAGGSFALLGSGDPAIASMCGELAGRFPGRASVTLGFDPALAARIYGGADMLLIPSRYEPCGLTQMISQRYGCVPVARRTGGLADTIDDASLSGVGTGFLFNDPDAGAVSWALTRAREVYAHPQRWREIQRLGMKKDFSWREPARFYGELFDRARALRA